jgi:hypothetical protein
MKKSTFIVALSTAFACAVLQTRPAAAQKFFTEVFKN